MGLILINKGRKNLSNEQLGSELLIQTGDPWEKTKLMHLTFGNSNYFTSKPSCLKTNLTKGSVVPHELTNTNSWTCYSSSHVHTVWISCFQAQVWRCHHEHASSIYHHLKISNVIFHYCRVHKTKQTNKKTNFDIIIRRQKICTCVFALEANS